ncbi:hypothetical protein V8E54_007675 [Elaphomyces granulatus]
MDATSTSERNATPREQDDPIEINESTKEFHCAADLTRFRNRGGTLSARELKELKARTKTREEMVELEKRMRAIENAETPISPEGTTEPTDPSSPSSFSSSSDSDSESNSSSSNSESSDRGRSRRKKHKSKYKGIKVTPHITLRIDSSLREWGDWKREMERVFEGDPRTYGKGRQKILKALDFVDQPLVTLWYTYRDRKEKRKNHKMKRWSKFLAWTKKKIQGGQNSTANMYTHYDAARHRPDESPYHFDSFLSSIERDLPEKDDEDLAFAFYSKLSSELKRQFQTAHIKPKRFGKHYTLNIGNRRSTTSATNFRGKDKDSKEEKGHKRHWHTRGNSQQQQQGKKKKLNDDTFKERTDKNLCYNCGKSGHYAIDCQNKKSSKDDNISKVQQTRAERRSTSPEAETTNGSSTQLRVTEAIKTKGVISPLAAAIPVSVGIDTYAEVDIIDIRFVRQLGLKPCRNKNLPILRAVNQQNLSTYGAYNVRLELTDSNGIRRETLRPYLAIDRDKDDIQILFGMPALEKRSTAKSTSGNISSAKTTFG